MTESRVFEMLHIVNGGCAVQALQQAAIPGDFLSWDDLLYEGPVPVADSLSRLSALRAEFVSDAGWCEISVARDRFERRDRALGSCGNRNEVILWNSFELTDQLQLLQLLHWFSEHLAPETRLRILFVADYLSSKAEALVRRCWGRQTDVTGHQLSMGGRLWSAFCANSPLELCRLRQEPAVLQEFPFMGPALDRLFEEFPEARDGLSRTQRQILWALETRPLCPVELFEFSQSRESRRFLGDWSCWRLLDWLAGEPEPLIECKNRVWTPFSPLRPDLQADFLGQRIAITPAGRDVLAGRADAVELKGIDRWVGGVHLRPAKVWRWDGPGQCFISTSH